MSIWSFLESFFSPPPDATPKPEADREADREADINKMKVLDFEDSHSKVFKLVTREIPTPKEKEVLIKILATTITIVDLVRRQYRSFLADKKPMIDIDPLLGMECSGEIIALGSGVSEFRVGDKVCALLSGGGYAEYVALDLWRVLPIPNGVGADEAAALPYTASVVWFAFFMVGNLIPNSSVMIYDAVGEFSSLAIQLAKLHGCTVFVAGTHNSYQANYCKDLGADFCIADDDDNLIERVLHKTRGRGVDFIFDPCGSNIREMLETISPGGTIVIAGVNNINKSAMDLRHLIEKRIKLVGLKFIGLSYEDHSKILQEIYKELWPRFERGELVLKTYSRRFDFHHASLAHATMKARVNLGNKILLVPAK